ncbi:MAG TPA: BON domain-containing protein [Solirubrobacteraceae bacterium]|nr:BON domain-containing protein [Solirubrobacteraceae bacterium]
MSTQVSIEAAVTEALRSDPRVPHPEEIAVTVEEDAVTLRGTVGSFSQRRAAVRDSRKVDGVHYVYDDLLVRLLDAAGRSDAELRGMVLQAIAWDTEAPADLIDVKVQDGWVTLRGTVSWQFQSDAAYDDVASLFGVIGITNDIRVVNP